ncbi:dTDP-4-dehydrorhamnose reductase [Stenotrophomonas sp. VV52]|uniref:dTDP-4-dehydrorhamnose reductase n=1 Tax=Stenotrophomonas sp. VV52 TaxID=2066958 RepID=UPI00209C2726|nr:dTDP-4-dehydrorhamnose reductase [Stenotrophomonas sp. VV52]
MGRVLVLGASGQVGRELLRALEPVADVVAATRSGHVADGWKCENADLNAPESLTPLLERLRPDWVVNAAAYTAVDLAEVEGDAAWRINAEAPGVIARWCAAKRVPFVHFSTDYVFDGNGATPYREEDATSPLSVYGRSKAAGEMAVRAAGGTHLILRTAWVFASHGSNFLRTMLRLADTRDSLDVVSDQVGTPTSAALIADVTVQLIKRGDGLTGTWHLTARGETSWYGFARAIFARAETSGLISRQPFVNAISSDQYPTRVRRPSFSRLDTSKLETELGMALPEWEEGLNHVIDEMVQGEARIRPDFR